MSQELLKEVQRGDFPVVGFVGNVYLDHPSAYTVLITRKEDQLIAKIRTKEIVVNDHMLLREDVVTGEELIVKSREAEEHKARSAEINEKYRDSKEVWLSSNITGDVTFRFVNLK